MRDRSPQQERGAPEGRGPGWARSLPYRITSTEHTAQVWIRYLKGTHAPRLPTHMKAVMAKNRNAVTPATLKCRMCGIAKHTGFKARDGVTGMAGGVAIMIS